MREQDQMQVSILHKLWLIVSFNSCPKIDLDIILGDQFFNNNIIGRSSFSVNLHFIYCFKISTIMTLVSQVFN